MSKADTALTEAMDNLYLRVRGRNTSRLENTYFSWCKENNIPYVKIVEAYKYASVWLITDTTPNVLSIESLEKLIQLALSYGIKTGNVSHSSIFLNIDKVPNERAGALAVDMLSIYETEKRKPA